MLCPPKFTPTPKERSFRLRFVHASAAAAAADDDGDDGYSRKSFFRVELWTCK